MGAGPSNRRQRILSRCRAKQSQPVRVWILNDLAQRLDALIPGHR